VQTMQTWYPAHMHCPTCKGLMHKDPKNPANRRFTCRRIQLDPTLWFPKSRDCKVCEGFKFRTLSECTSCSTRPVASAQGSKKTGGAARASK
jgi:hypothetical protein